MNGNFKTWTGKTVRQELHGRITIFAAAGGLTTNDALEAALDGSEAAAPSSILNMTLRYWNALSTEGQRGLLASCRRELKRGDALMGRKVAR